MDSESDLIETVCELIEIGTATRKEILELLKSIQNRSRLEWPKRSPLVSAVKSGKKTLLNDMIYKFSFDINSTTVEWHEGNWCALGAAIHANNFDLARYLIAKGLDLKNIKNKILKDAISFGSVESVKFFLEEVGIDVNFKMWFDDNMAKQFLPIHFAISSDVAK
jgi:hypothetical protein